MSMWNCDCDWLNDFTPVFVAASAYLLALTKVEVISVDWSAINEHQEDLIVP